MLQGGGPSRRTVRTSLGTRDRGWGGQDGGRAGVFPWDARAAPGSSLTSSGVMAEAGEDVAVGPGTTRGEQGVIRESRREA